MSENTSLIFVSYLDRRIETISFADCGLEFQTGLTDALYKCDCLYVVDIGKGSRPTLETVWENNIDTVNVVMGRYRPTRFLMISS